MLSLPHKQTDTQKLSKLKLGKFFIQNKHFCNIYDVVVNSRHKKSQYQGMRHHFESGGAKTCL